MLLFDQRMFALTIIAKPNQATTSKYELFVAKSETSHVLPYFKYRNGISATICCPHLQSKRRGFSN